MSQREPQPRPPVIAPTLAALAAATRTDSLSAWRRAALAAGQRAGLDGYALAALDHLVWTTAGPPRRRRGAFYTPLEVARAVTAATLQPLLDRSTTAAAIFSLTVLDPAVGGGVFLLAALEQLTAAALTRPDAVGLSEGEVRRRVARDCLWGLDSDPQAVAVARAALHRETGESGRLAQGDFLAGRRWAELCHPTPPERSRHVPPALSPPLAGATTPETVAAAPPAGFAAVVGNPPFLSVKRGQLKARAAELRERFRLARGQWDSYMLFVEQALGLLAPTGRLGFVLPRPALVNDQAAPLRRLLLEEAGIEGILEFGQPFAGAGVETIGLIADRAGGEVIRLPAGEAPRARVARSPGCRLSPGLERAGWELLERLEAAPLRLGELVELSRGLEIGKRHPALDRDPTGGAPVLRGEDVAAWRARSSWWLHPERLRPTERKDPALFAPRPKLLIRRVADRPLAALDTAGCWVLNTLYIVRPRAEVELAWLALCLNSEPAGRWYRLRHAAAERLFPYLRQSQLLELPLPEPTADLLALARRLTAAPTPANLAAAARAVGEAYGLTAPELA